MEVRVLTEDDKLFGIYDEDTYITARDDATIEDPDTGEIVEIDVHIHPDDIPALANVLGKRRIDSMLADLGISEREMRVWTANLSLLNLAMISSLIEASDSDKVDQYRDIATSVLASLETGESVISVLGNDNIIKKAMAFGVAVKPVVLEVFGKPVLPEL